MQQQVFINLPVKDLQASIAFFSKLGYTFNAQFTDETGTCMIISDTIYVMLLTEEKFASFIDTPVTDAHKQTEIMIALNCENNAAVDDIVAKAVAAGGTTYGEARDHGFMYGHGFRDLDGHIWEVFYMDMNAIPA